MISPNDILGRPSGGKSFDDNYECFLTPLPKTETRGQQGTLKALKNTIPKVYRAFMPRLYCGADRYYDWRLPRLVSLLGTAAARQDPELAQSYQAYLNLCSFSLLWAEYDTPTFFVSQSLLDAVMQSGLPKDFDFTGLKLPFPAVTFIFPKGSRALTQDGHAVQYVGLAHITESINTEIGEVNVAGAIDKFVVTTGFYPNTFMAAGYKTSHLNEVVTMDIDTLAVASHRPGSQAPVKKDEVKLTHDCLKLAFALVLAMEARPELVEHGRQVSVIRKGGESRTLWTPNVIGAKYQVKREASGGTHGSPRTHWRRGHFRRQGVGHRNSACTTCGHPVKAHYHEPVPAFDPPLPIEHCELSDCTCEFYAAPAPYSEYKTVWLEPMLIAGKLAAAG